MEKYEYLPLELVKKYEKLADYYGISEKSRGLKKPTKSDVGFLVIYKKYHKTPKKLSEIPVRKDKPDGVKWDKHRINQVKAKFNQMKRMNIPLYHLEGKLKGLPTKMHVNMIMWAYSPDPKTLSKKLHLLKQLNT